MAVFSASLLIKELRTKMGISVERLCEGICDASTLRKIEKGERSPSIYIVTRLFERMGVDARKYYMSMSSSHEVMFYNKYNKVTSLLLREKYEESATLIKEMEFDTRNIALDEGGSIRTQMILSLQCSIMQVKGENPITRKVMIYEALSITMPNFNEENISDSILSYDESSLIMMLATVYKELGEPEKNINILYQLKNSMDKFYHDEYEKSRGYIQVLFNLSNELGFQGRNDEVINICDLAIQCCVSNKRLSLLPHIKFNMGMALYKKNGENDKSTAMVREAVYALRNNENPSDASLTQKLAEDIMGVSFPF